MNSSEDVDRKEARHPTFVACILRDPVIQKLGAFKYCASTDWPRSWTKLLSAKKTGYSRRHLLPIIRLESRK